VKILRDKFEARADALIDRSLSVGSFDAVTEFAEVFPVLANPEKRSMGFP
jgi:hypothetical protein